MSTKCLFAIATMAALACVAPSAGAADLPITSTMTQPAGHELEAGIGMPVFKLTRTSPLPNAFGMADVFGRKVDRGYVELRYQGIASDGRLVFRLTDVETRSTETTMNRTPMTVGTGQATVTGTGNSATVRGSSFTMRGQPGTNELLPANTTEFAIDPEKRKEFRAAGVTVKILEADETNFRYVLTAPAVAQ